jgi:hypothetical protein
MMSTRPSSRAASATGERDGLADSASGAGNQRHLVFESHRVTSIR